MLFRSLDDACESVARHLAGAGGRGRRVVAQRAHDGEQNGRVLAPKGRVTLPQILVAVKGKAIFRGALDVRASDINDEMKIAAAYAIAGLVSDEELCADYILPAAFDSRVKDAVAKATAEAAIKSGVARI